jgi:potassium-transporting ATPase KdpC subunit
MQKTLLIALRTTVVTLLLTGILYPFVITGLAQILFPWRANGSLITNEQGQVVGSELIGQGFTHPAYFQTRPSAAGVGYDATASSGSNLGPTSKKLLDRVIQDLARLKEENPSAQDPVPVELVTTSASGLDPHLSPQAALWQIPRIASARGITSERVKTVLEAVIEGRDIGVLGERRVNVLLLNLALDRQFGRPAPVQAQDRKDRNGESAASAQPSVLSGQPSAD